MRSLAWLLPLVCLLSCSEGAPGALGRRASAIIGGAPDSGAQAHDSVVALSLTTTGGLCSGSLIAPNLVLTARHCVSVNTAAKVACNVSGTSQNGDHVGDDLPPASILVFTGQSPDLAGSPAATGAKIYHPDGKILCNSDLALILLSASVPGAKPMALRLGFGPQIGDPVTPVGYGDTSDSQAGTRFRREGVPVVSVGQDYNFFTGASEFVLGQSTCQGDSGGPVLAGDTGAIVGVASRGGDCLTGFQRFTRTDAHKTLIEQALADAGATALEEGTSAPAKPPKTPVGQGPCEVGSQCQGSLCVDHGPSGFCSTPCYPGLCAAGFVCRDRPVSVQDGTITSPICVAAPGDNACESCRYTKCKTALETCLTDAKCAPFAACADACTSPDCLAACAASDPAGAALYKPVSACECSAKCAPACADLCASPGSGGAGGSGGSAGSGDAGQQAAGSGDAGSGDAGSGQSGKGQAGQQAAGSGDAGGAPAGGASGSEQGGASANTPPDAGSSGGCHAARGPGAGASWALLALAWLAARRRRVQPPASKASSDGATVM